VRGLRRSRLGIEAGDRLADAGRDAGPVRCWCGSPNHPGEWHVPRDDVAGDVGADVAEPAVRAETAALTERLEAFSPGQRDDLLYWLCGYIAPAVQRGLADLRLVPPAVPGPPPRRPGPRHRREHAGDH
jgi:hypothetical protein